MVFCGALESNKNQGTCQTGYLLESKGFHIGNVVSADFFGVHGFRNVSVTTCSARPQAKLFAIGFQVVTLTDHNDVMLLAALSAGTKTYFSWSSFKHSFTEFCSRIPCLLDSTVFLRLLTLDLTICFTCCTQSSRHS